MHSKPHRNNFDFIRVVAALFVVVSHQFALAGRPEPTVLNVHSLGGLGVLIFFSVSGYLVSQSWLADPHVLRFAARRFLRIWPGLAAVVLLSTFVWGPLVTTLPLREYLTHSQVREYLHNLVFDMTAHGALPLKLTGNALPYAVNGALWTIPLEVECYVLLAVLGVCGVLRWKWLVVALTAACVILVEARGDALASSMGLSVEHRALVQFAQFFAVGVVLQYFFDGSARRVGSILGASWLAGLIAIQLGRPALGLLLIVPCTVLWIGTRSTPGLRSFGRFGDFSYGLYIFAFPIQQTLIWLNKDRLPWGVLLLVTLVTTFAMAFLSWHLVEKRALRLKPSRPKTSRERTPAVEALQERAVAISQQ